MKKLSLLISAAFMVAAGVANAEPLKMAFSSEPYPPFTFKASSGEWTGFEVELGQAICAQMQTECELAPTGWSGIIPSLNAGKVDFILGSMSITDERDKVIDFSDPYYDAGAIYVGRTDMDFAGEGDLDGKVLAVQGATTHAGYARKKLNEAGADIRIYDQHEQMIRDLQAGRVDLILADQIAMISFLGRDDAAGYTTLAEAPADPLFGKGVGVGLRDGDDDLTAKMNTAIHAVIDDGTCTELSQRYFDTDICAK
ncbi:transporter substrate-binding domain-containing protein [Paracoccus sp. Z330]|uniref:Transporter substrate-binding domain-containing protein n=1 Tax=Paracoccus onchidii TaxID=3017813 RepID=A0ABT4ZFZ3_9RHOB|nr:transporter substrate-binding domain-containing protein [Paracoccus onchidii]MDB6178289.1 transporter substrate-binding domain-containing protein [Paracoccus onchidii]